MSAFAKPHLPNEILAEIFKFANEDAHFRLPRSSNIEDDKARFIHVPYTCLPSFAQVCRQWRNAALECSRLWCQISIDWPTKRYTPEVVESRKNLAKLWIQRSGIQPLSIACESIGCGTEPSKYDVLVTKAILDVIKPHLHRLEFLRLYGHVPTIAEFFRRVGPKALPILSTFLLCDTSDDDSEEWWFQDTFKDCSNLHTIVIDYWSSPSDRLYDNLPWLQLTRFSSCHPIDARHALKILEACLQLQDATFCISENIGVFDRRVTSPSLKSISVITTSASAIGFLSFLMLPNLETFRLTHAKDKEMDTMIQIETGIHTEARLCHAIRLLFEISDCPLTTFVVHSGDTRFCSDARLMDILGGLPRLENLILCQDQMHYFGYTPDTARNRVWITKATLRKFASGKLLPQLKRLRVECPTGFDEPILLDLVRRRRSRRAEDANWERLEFMYVILGKPISDAAREELEHAGLRNGAVENSYVLS